MAKTFIVPLPANPDSFFQQIRQKAKNAGATIEGNSQSGTFSGSGVKGRYVQSNGQLQITITDKPFIASWGMVEGKIREVFGG